MRRAGRPVRQGRRPPWAALPWQNLHLNCRRTASADTLAWFPPSATLVSAIDFRAGASSESVAGPDHPRHDGQVHAAGSATRCSRPPSRWAMCGWIVTPSTSPGHSKLPAVPSVPCRHRTGKEHAAAAFSKGGARRHRSGASCRRGRGSDPGGRGPAMAFVGDTDLVFAGFDHGAPQCEKHRRVRAGTGRPRRQGKKRPDPAWKSAEDLATPALLVRGLPDIRELAAAPTLSA